MKLTPTVLLAGLATLASGAIALSAAGARTYLGIAGATWIEVPREDPEMRAGHLLFEDAPRGFELAMGEVLAPAD